MTWRSARMYSDIVTSHTILIFPGASKGESMCFLVTKMESFSSQYFFNISLGIFSLGVVGRVMMML